MPKFILVSLESPCHRPLDFWKAVVTVSNEMRVFLKEKYCHETVEKTLVC